MSGRVYIGIDPGQSGALAAVGDGWAYAVPWGEREYIDALKRIIGRGGEVRAVVEHVGAMPKQGLSSTFKFGANFGWVQGVLAALGIPYELVRPLKWKKEFSCTSDKNTSIAVAKRLFPMLDLRRTERCVKEHDGKAEALLMAEYCRRKRENGSACAPCVLDEQGGAGSGAEGTEAPSGASGADAGNK